MANEEKLKQDIHDLLKMLARANRWIDTVETTYVRHFKNARHWFESLEERLKEISRDLIDEDN